MKKKSFLFIFFVSIISFQLYSITFVQYCQLSESGKVPSSIAHTVNTLLVIAKTTDCSIAFKRLNKLSYLSLSNKKLTSVQPLYGLTQLKSLDLSDNNISSIWGIEHNKALEHLNVSKNNISDIAPISLLKKLVLVDFTENKLTDITPLKNHTNLLQMDICLDQNPIFQNKEELYSIEKIKKYRLLINLGLIDDSILDQSESLMFLFDLIEQGDYFDFKNIIKKVILSDQTIDCLSIKAKRFLLSAKQSEYMITSILNKIEVPAEQYKDLHLNLTSILELIILDPKIPLFNKKSLDNLEAYIIQKIYKHSALLQPLLFFKLCQQWAAHIIKTGIPIGIRSGFNV